MTDRYNAACADQPKTRGRRRYAVAGQAIEAPPLAAGLYLVATPIGNLRDITLRALEMLAAADLVACEDTRVTRKLLDHYGIATPLTPYHEHNAAAARPKLLARLAAGERRRAGVRRRHAADLRSRLQAGARGAARPVMPVTAAPGASAVLTALTVAGLPTDRFFFEGFLPAEGRRSAARASPSSRAFRRRCAVRERAAARRARSPISRRASARARPRSAAS